LLSEVPTDYEISSYSPNDIIGASFGRTSNQKYPEGYNGKLRVEIWVDGQVVKSQDSDLAGSATVVYSPFLDSQCSSSSSEFNLPNLDWPNHVPNPDLPNPHISTPHLHFHSHSHHHH
jgi:hypothetical protein